MTWRLFSIAAALSCVLAVGVAISWIRSYWVYDQVACGSASDGRCEWTSYSASFDFPRWPLGIPKGASDSALTSAGKVLLLQAIYSESGALGISPHGYGWSSDDNVIPSFSYFYAVTGDMSRSGNWTIRQVSVPHWALVLVLAVLPAVWLLASRRGYRPAKPAPDADST